MTLTQVSFKMLLVRIELLTDTMVLTKVPEQEAKSIRKKLDRTNLMRKLGELSLLEDEHHGQLLML